jgi:serine/threonine protein phosphatase PrpC
MDYHEESLIGSRERQEDACAIHVCDDGSGALLLLADGMGGYEGGHVASSLAVRSFASDFLKPNRKSIRERLCQALAAAHEALKERIRQDRELEDMGTTLVAVAIRPNSLRWISLGDSPLFLLRNGRLRRLNDDHSYRPTLEFLRHTGRLSAEGARLDPRRHSLRFYLDGTRAPTKYDCPKTTLRLRLGDRVLIASDGIETLEPEKITTLLGRWDRASDCAAGLIDAVSSKALTSQDNTTIQVAIVG